MPKVTKISRDEYSKIINELENAERDYNGSHQAIELLLSYRPVEVKEGETIKNADDLKKWDDNFSSILHNMKVGRRNARERVEVFTKARRAFVMNAVAKNEEMFKATEKLVLSTIPAK